jgi:hypothetical protein
MLPLLETDLESSEEENTMVSFNDLLTVLEEEREALLTWRESKDLPPDVLEGIEISLSKVEGVLIDAGHLD